MPSHAPVSPPNSKRAKYTHTNTVGSDLGKLQSMIDTDVADFKRLGWTEFVKHKRPSDDFGSLHDLHHPARRLLRQYKHRGAPVVLHSSAWTPDQINTACLRGPHKSCYEYIDFLEEEFITMLHKQQWVLLPYDAVKQLRHLHLSPPGVVPQRDRRPRWICDYTWSGVNQDTAPIAPKDAMQFGHALDRLLRQILLANPSDGPVYIIKLDISDGFYRIALVPADVPKLGVIFPTRPGVEPIVAFPLVLPMGWANSPPIFSAATETIADITNQRLLQQWHAPSHHLDDLAASIPPEQLASTPPCAATNSSSSSPTAPSSNPTRNPFLGAYASLLQYVDVFVDDFMALSQGSASDTSYVRRVLLHSIDAVFRPLKPGDHPGRIEPVSIKKLHKGDGSWATTKIVLGWLVDTIAQTVALPQHRVDRLFEILDSIPSSQKRTSVKKWHKILGELRSMALAMPGSRNMFSHMQHALRHKVKGRISLSKGVHQALSDFRWMAEDISNRPTRIAEIIPLPPSCLGDHDASGSGAGGAWFPSSQVNTRHNHAPDTAIAWRLQWPPDITAALVSSDNPNGTITNSDLELAGGLLHLDACVHCFDVRERTILSRTDNLATLFWQRKGSSSLDSCPAHLLRLFGIHQRYHRYVPRHDYLPGKSNLLGDHASRLFHLSDEQFLTYLSSLLPQSTTFKLWTPSPQIVSAVISALRRKMLKPESVLVEPPPVTHIGENGLSSLPNWPSIPYSKPSKTRYQSYKSSAGDFVAAAYQPAKISSALEQLKSTYGQLGRRSLQWGAQIHG